MTRNRDDIEASFRRFTAARAALPPEQTSADDTLKTIAFGDSACRMCALDVPHRREDCDVHVVASDDAPTRKPTSEAP